MARASNGHANNAPVHFMLPAFMALARSAAAIMAITVHEWAFRARGQPNTLMQDTACSLLPVRQQQRGLFVRVQRYLYSCRAVRARLARKVAGRALDHARREAGRLAALPCQEQEAQMTADRTEVLQSTLAVTVKYTKGWCLGEQKWPCT